MPGEITELLAEVRDGNTASESRLAELVYEQLHGIAARYMRFERPDHSLQATLLVDDAYLHLINQEDRNWQNRSHFYPRSSADFFTVDLDDVRSPATLPTIYCPWPSFLLAGPPFAIVMVNGRWVIRDQRHPLQEEIVCQVQRGPSQALGKQLNWAYPIYDEENSHREYL